MEIVIQKIPAYPTLNERLKDTQYRPSGFDYMRLVLALGVISLHSNLLSYGANAAHSWLWRDVLDPAAILIVPMFFALSGFLIAGSLERSKTLITFIGLRVLRIAPALCVEVLLSALILGPLVTTVPLAEYFSDKQFHLYFWNILGDIHYRLPGVFHSNPFPDIVNGQLWTIPYELICYITLTALAASTIFRRRNWLLAFLAACYAAQAAYMVFISPAVIPAATGATAVICFIAGLVIYQYRNAILWSKPLFFLCFIATMALLAMPNGVRFIALPVAYMTVFVGLFNPPRNKIMLSGDYSYGLYLYGFAVQQALIAFFPVTPPWYTSLLAVLPCAVLVAVASWWLVEKPALRQRQKLKDMEEWYIRKREALYKAYAGVLPEIRESSKSYPELELREPIG